MSNIFDDVEEAYKIISTLKGAIISNLMIYWNKYEAYYTDGVVNTFDIGIHEASEEVLSRHRDRRFEVKFRTRNNEEGEHIWSSLRLLVGKLSDDHGLESSSGEAFSSNPNNMMYRYFIQISPELYDLLLVVNNLEKDSFKLYLEI